MKPLLYKCVTWKQNYVVFIGCTYLNMCKFLSKNYNFKLGYINCAGLCFEFSFKDKDYIGIWVGDKTDFPSLVHECVHAACITLQHAGVKASFKNDEPLAYLTEELYDAFTNLHEVYVEQGEE